MLKHIPWTRQHVLAICENIWSTTNQVNFHYFSFFIVFFPTRYPRRCTPELFDGMVEYNALCIQSIAHRRVVSVHETAGFGKKPIENREPTIENRAMVSPIDRLSVVGSRFCIVPAPRQGVRLFAATSRTWMANVTRHGTTRRAHISRLRVQDGSRRQSRTAYTRAIPFSTR